MKKTFLTVLCFYFSMQSAFAQTTTTTPPGLSIEFLKTANAVSITLLCYPLVGCEGNSGQAIYINWPGEKNTCTWSGNKFTCTELDDYFSCHQPKEVEIVFNDSGDTITSIKGLRQWVAPEGQRGDVVDNLHKLQYACIDNTANNMGG